MASLARHVAAICHMLFLRHIIFNTTKEMITHFDMLREIFTDFLYVATEVYAFFDVSRQSASARFVRKLFARE